MLINFNFTKSFCYNNPQIPDKSLSNVCHKKITNVQNKITFILILQINEFIMQILK